MTDPTTAPDPGATPTPTPAPAAPAAPERPAWVGETYWDATKGGIKDEFGAHYTEIANFHKTETERRAALPQKPDDYKAEIGTLPDTFKVPEGMEIKIDEKDPRLPLAREFAREAGLSQEQFSRLLQFDAISKINAHAAETARVAAETQKLGDKAPERITAANNWLGTLGLQPEELSEMRLTASTAAGVTAIEKLMAKVAGHVPGNTGDPPPPKPLDVPLEQRMYPPRKAS